MLPSLTTILSTKKLKPSQREHLLNAQLAIVDYDFIKTEKIAFSLSARHIDKAIFTSQKGVEVVLDSDVKIKKAYCVGNRTAKLLEENGVDVAYAATNARELGNYIISKERKCLFYYFCAKDRLDTLPDALTLEKVQWEEVPVYKTIQTPKVYKQDFRGVLFFSPSGVESYYSVNKAPEHSFCIGETTAKALKRYTQNYTIATMPSVENVLVKAIKHFKK